MAGEGRYRLAAIAGLAREYAFASTAVRRRVSLRAERLVEAIEPGRGYPLDFVVFRLSGYRPESAGELLDGESLLADLSRLVLEFSLAAPLGPADRPGGAVAFDELPAEAGVSVRTIHRWRRGGLCCHWVRIDGRVRLACFRECLARHRRRVAGDAGPRPHRRLGREERVSIREAFAAAIEAGAVPTRAARDLAASFGRSLDTIRRACADLSPRPPRKCGRERFRRLLKIAARHLIAPREVAIRKGRSGEAAARELRSIRLESLRRLDLPIREFPTFLRADAGGVLLSSRWARGGFAEAWWWDAPLADLLLAAERSDAARACEDAEEILAVEAWLLRSCSRRIAALEGPPPEGEIDGIETMLRFAMRLRQRAAQRLLPLVATRIGQRLGHPLLSRTATEIASLLARSLGSAAGVLDRFEAPASGGSKRRQPSLRGVLTLALDRDLEAACAALPATRAAARHRQGTLLLGDPRRLLASWGWEADFASRWRGRIDRLGEERRGLLMARFGWGDQPPMTVAALAAREGVAEPRLRRRLQAACDELRAATLVLREPPIQLAHRRQGT